ncbi:hypothetical protein ABZS29_29250 [Kribbella sp. NPDC005582]|uniref:hypothetical protein n=1 Tax=Kribbella sp. NPDC005582 TaxID=3156893 RepID=UPI00339F0E86
MTYYDESSGERNDRAYIGYEFTDHAVTGINLACNGKNPLVAIDLGGMPLDVELITGSVTALSQLIDALYEARQLLEDHQVEHIAEDMTRSQDAVYIPAEWTEDQP